VDKIGIHWSSASDHYKGVRPRIVSEDIMIEIRKIIISRETVFSELGIDANRPITRVVGMR
jgi:hypothetical protein